MNKRYLLRSITAQQKMAKSVKDFGVSVNKSAYSISKMARAFRAEKARQKKLYKRSIK